MKKFLLLIISICCFQASAKVFMTSDFSNKNIADYFAKNKSIGIAPYTVFIGCDFTKSELVGLILDNITFIGCKFPGASFKGASLIGTSFISEKTFGETIFDSKTNFNDADMRDVDMSTIDPKTILQLKQTLKKAKTDMIKLRKKKK